MSLGKLDSNLEDVCEWHIPSSTQIIHCSWATFVSVDFFLLEVNFIMSDTGPIYLLAVRKIN